MKSEIKISFNLRQAIRSGSAMEKDVYPQRKPKSKSSIIFFNLKQLTGVVPPIRLLFTRDHKIKNICITKGSSIAAQ